MLFPSIVFVLLHVVMIYSSITHLFVAVKVPSEGPCSKGLIVLPLYGSCGAHPHRLLSQTPPPLSNTAAAPIPEPVRFPNPSESVCTSERERVRVRVNI